jgi:hypothetical protein
MPTGTIYLLENCGAAPEVIAPVAAEFGWEVERITTAQLAQAKRNEQAVAVLFRVRQDEAAWKQTLADILEVAPQVFPIACHGNEIIPWPDMADAGAFHAVHVPIDAGEARQSLGFVWAARQHQGSKVFLVRRAASREEGKKSVGSAA